MRRWEEKVGDSSEALRPASLVHTAANSRRGLFLNKGGEDQHLRLCVYLHNTHILVYAHVCTHIHTDTHIDTHAYAHVYPHRHTHT